MVLCPFDIVELPLGSLCSLNELSGLFTDTVCDPLNDPQMEGDRLTTSLIA